MTGSWGAYCTLVLGGKIKIDTNDAAVLTAKRGRTAVGTQIDGTVVVLVTQDNEGLTGQQLAERMLGQQCVYAVNLDGGGSSGYIGPDKPILYTARKLDSFLGLWLTEGSLLGVKAYSNAADGGKNLSAHFKVREFACHDGSDTVLIGEQLIDVLEKIRAGCGGKAVTVNSGYRTPSYNSKIGGAAKSQHMEGRAADIAIAGVSPAAVCEQAEIALAALHIAGGVGLYDTFTHVDTRALRARWQQDKSTGQQQVPTAGYLPTIRRG
ncbi:MAG: phosphodiester glycosidase family protein, partial [Oscillospiraceae bacterium]|nr:phosphodiester glycosidase family protein [Oscillospiraceae bacterium]